MKIINLLKRFAVIALFLMAGCSSSPTTTYIYSPPTGADGIACVDECKQSRATCEKMCTTPDTECLANAQENAKYDYQEYVDKQNSTGEPVLRSMGSFNNVQQCLHAGCGCAHEFEVCYQLCGTRTELTGPTATE